MPGSPFIDGFPADAAQADYAIHQIIDSELRNCDALKGTRALPRLLYPAYFATTTPDREAWLEPSLRRFAWHDGRQPWHDYLLGLLRMVITGMETSLSDEILLLMAKLGPRLQTNGGGDCRAIESIAANLRARKKPLPPQLVSALKPFLYHLVGVHCHAYSTFEVAWRLWQSPECLDDGESCFSAVVRRELLAMEPGEAEAWRAWLDLRPRNPAGSTEDHAPGGRWRRAIRQIGEKNFAAHWDGWIGWMYENQPAALSPPGRDLLLLFLHSCRTAPELPVDHALCQLAGVQWAAYGNHLLTKEWLGVMLEALATRPATPAFACAERLSQNPGTRCFLEVRKLYNHLLAETVGESVMPDRTLGVDGYDLGCQPELYRQQVILDRCLRDVVPQQLPPDVPGPPQSAWGCAEMTSMLARRQSRTAPESFVRAAANRSRWLKETRKPPEVLERRETVFGLVEMRADDPYVMWRAVIDEVLRQLLAGKPALGHDDLIALMESDEQSGCGIASPAFFAVLTEYTSTHGFTPQMVNALKRWHDGFHGSHAAVSIRHRIGWLLWLEDVAPIDEKACWSQRIRKDLRTMPKAARAAWRTLFENTNLAKTRKPSKRWEKAAKAVLARIPADEFRIHLRQWLEPFRIATPMHLTVPGRAVLRNLMWLALPAQDPAVDEAVARFASAKWRSKRDRKCAESLLPTFLYVLTERSPELAHQALEAMHANGTEVWGKTHRLYQDLCARLGKEPKVEPRPAAQPQAAEELIPSMLRRFTTSSKVRLEADRLQVTGVRDSYTIHVNDSRIVRQSDGASIRVEVDYSQTPWMQSMIDSLDMEHPFRPNYYRLVMCAQVLLEDDENSESIVAETEEV